MKIGILALQGAFIEHEYIFAKLGIKTAEIRLPGHINDIDGLIIPGGESTTLMNLMQSYNLIEPIQDFAHCGRAVWGICAGMICLARKAYNPDRSIMKTLSLMDITVRRNACGRQVYSFEEPLKISGINNGTFPGVFIRAPFIEKTGSNVDIICKLASGEIVAARQNNLLVTSFHPELTDDTRFHSYFIRMIAGQRGAEPEVTA